MGAHRGRGRTDISNNRATPLVRDAGRTLTYLVVSLLALLLKQGV